MIRYYAIRGETKTTTTTTALGPISLENCDRRINWAREGVTKKKTPDEKEMTLGKRVTKDYHAIGFSPI